MTELSELINNLRSENSGLRVEAAEAICELGTEARSAAVALTRAAGDESEDVREWAVASLESLGSPDGDLASDLKTLLSDDNPDVAYWAATLLGRLGAAAAVAVGALAGVLNRTHPLPVRQRSAWALGRIGPVAASAIEALQSASQNDDPRLARLASRAIGQIQGQAQDESTLAK